LAALGIFAPAAVLGGAPYRDASRRTPPGGYRS